MPFFMPECGPWTGGTATRDDIAGRSVAIAPKPTIPKTKLHRRYTKRPPAERLAFGDVVPIFRWAGSKRKSLHILSLFWSDKFGRYIEPFAGSACLFLRVKPRTAILADLNSSLIAAYRTIRNSPADVAELLYDIPRNAKTYYEIRDRIKSAPRSIQRTAYFVYLNRNCFNGIYRTNCDGHFNVPFGACQGHYPRPCDFHSVAKLLKHATLLCADFGTTLKHVRANDFVYLDPPFAATGVRTFVEYGKQSFGNDDVDRLSRHLDRIDRRNAYFLVSYADCTRAQEIAKDWNSAVISVRRQVAGFTAKRKMASEMIITNLPLPEVLCPS
jgi:DNA adenine methylase